MKLLSQIILPGILLVLIDYIYLNAISSFFNKQIFNIQKSPIKLRFSGAIICYVLLVFGLYYFIISQNKKEFYDLVKDFMYEYYTWEYDKDYVYNDILDEQINIMKDPDNDLEKWAIECLWWGRRNEKFFKDSYEVL